MSWSIRRATALRCAAALTLVAGGAAPVAAQEADSLPFRKGQWGAEFSASDFAGVGVLRFLSPKTALLVNVQGRITRQDGRNNDNAFLHIVNNSDAIQTSLGWRRYGALAPRVVRHVGFGLQAFRNANQQEFGAFSTSVQQFPLTRTVNEGFGVYAEVGAQWMITRNLSLGASWSASAAATRAFQSTETIGLMPRERREVSTTGFSGVLSPLAVRAAIYF